MSQADASGIDFDANRMKEALRLLKPLNRLLSPVALGLEKVPREGAVLFVGNHTVFAVLDAPMLFMEIYEKTGRLVRALGDHLHFGLPLWRDLLRSFGTVDGTRENCIRLLEAGEPVLVFPGGGREVMKRKGEKYKLLWKERVGFARIAIQHGTPIVPFASVGVEDMFEIVADAEDILRSPLGDLLRVLGISKQAWFRDGDMIPPITIGKGIATLPRLERQYFLFGDPIDTTRFDQDRDACVALRSQVQEVVESEIQQLEAIRAADPERYPVQRLLRHLATRFG
jgi:1-acyl-sn-glycerol-3-phosphate acyltransferase